MANLQVKNVPDDIHDKLRMIARREGTTVREVVLQAVIRRIRMEEFEARLATRDAVDLGTPAVALVAEAREEYGERERG